MTEASRKSAQPLDPVLANIDELEKELVDVKTLLEISEKKRVRWNKVSSISFPVGLLIGMSVSFALSFVDTSAMKEKAEEFFFGETHAKPTQSQKFAPPKPLAPLSHINPTAIAERALKQQRKCSVPFRR